MKKIRKILACVVFICFTINLVACSNGHDDIPHRLQWWLGAMNWESENRTNGLTGKGVKIAVIDTAIDNKHPDLEGKIVDQYIVDGVPKNLEYEHGTAIAGIICAYPKTSEGVLGIAYNSQILSVVVSSGTEAQVENLIQGIEYAVSEKVDIINISAGIINDDPRLRVAIDNAFDAGIIVVAASGNDLTGQILYPAKYDNVISVDSVDSDGNRLYGESNASVLLPGGNIVTTYSSKHESKKYVSYSGTSMSCAMMSGVIALLLEQNPNLENKDILVFFQDYNVTDFDVIEVIKSFEVKEDIVYMQLPSKGFNGSPYYNYFALKAESTQFGSATITQYRYDICVYRDGGVNKVITDVVSNFTISSCSTMYVNNYFTRMHANISNMNIIGQSYLNSQSSSSYTLSGGFSANNQNVITGNVGVSTTNTYTTNNQNIQNDFYNQKYKNWNPTPTKKWKGASWEIEPAIRIINNNASSYKNQAYSSFRSGGWIGVVNIWGHIIPTVEVGGAW